MIKEILIIAGVAYYMAGVVYGFGWMDKRLRERGYWKLTDSPKKFLAQAVFGFIWLPYLVYRVLKTRI